MSPKKGDDEISTDLLTRKWTRSDDWRMTSAFGISEYFGGEMVLQVGLATLALSISSMGSAKSGSAYKVD